MTLPAGDSVHHVTPALERIDAGTRPDAWLRVSPDRAEGCLAEYNHPRILDRRITLADYDGPLRQVMIADLGHEEPTILLTNQLTATAARLIERYAQRMIIENRIADGIDIFHMDALSLAVAMKVNCDLQLTLMATACTACWPAASAGATNRPSRASVPGLRERHGPGEDDQVGHRGAVSEACPQPLAHRSRFRYDRDGHPLAGAQAVAARIRVASRCRPERSVV